MLAVVPGEEPLAEDAGVLEANRSGSGNSGRYFSVLNWASENGLSLETWGGEWLRVTPELRQQQRHGLAGYRGATIGVEEQLAWPDSLLRAGLGDQPLGERGRLAVARLV